LTYGSSGAGTANHLAGELFNIVAGVKLVHVPYQGAVQALPDLLTGRIQVLFSPASTVLPLVREGKITALASTQLQRASIAPDLPTMSEAGLKDFDSGVWTGLLAPAGTPREVIDKLFGVMQQVMKDADVIARLKTGGAEVLTSANQAAFAKYVVAETERWARIAKEANATPD